MPTFLRQGQDKQLSINYQRGNVVPVLLVVIVILVGAAVAYLLYSKGVIKSPGTQEQVRLNTQYLNPFEKETHYINPFDEYKNPFDVIGQDEVK